MHTTSTRFDVKKTLLLNFDAAAEHQKGLQEAKIGLPAMVRSHFHDFYLLFWGKNMYLCPQKLPYHLKFLFCMILNWDLHNFTIALTFWGKMDLEVQLVDLAPEPKFTKLSFFHQFPLKINQKVYIFTHFDEIKQNNNFHSDLEPLWKWSRALLGLRPLIMAHYIFYIKFPFFKNSFCQHSEVQQLPLYIHCIEPFMYNK